MNNSLVEMGAVSSALRVSVALPGLTLYHGYGSRGGQGVTIHSKAFFLLKLTVPPRNHNDFYLKASRSFLHASKEACL